MLYKWISFAEVKWQCYFEPPYFADFEGKLYENDNSFIKFNMANLFWELFLFHQRHGTASFGGYMSVILNISDTTKLLGLSFILWVL